MLFTGAGGEPEHRCRPQVQVLSMGTGADNGHACYSWAQVLMMSRGADYRCKCWAWAWVLTMCARCLYWSMRDSSKLESLALVSGIPGHLASVSLGRSRLVLCMKTENTHRAYPMALKRPRIMLRKPLGSSSLLWWLDFYQLKWQLSGEAHSSALHISLFAVRVTLVWGWQSSQWRRCHDTPQLCI